MKPRWKELAPLALHLAPTCIVGFGFVIPHSCIAGVNPLTVGFAVTNLGYVLTYLAGQRLARHA